MIKRIIEAFLILFLICAVLVARPVDSSKKVSLNFENVPIPTVLNMIAQQYDLNIVQSALTSDEISVKLDNVGIEDALKAILASNGYNYYFSGDIIVVKPLSLDAVGETVIELITLNYITPTSVVIAVTDMLSSKGTVKVIGGSASSESTKLSGSSARPTQIVVVDLAEVIEEINEFIAKVDVKPSQVSIEVKMIETNVDNEKILGIAWPTSMSAHIHDGGTVAEGSSSESTGSSINVLGHMQLPDGDWQWGKLSVAEAKIMLDFLKKDGNSKLISDPRITTMNNHKAEIKITTVIPIQTINRFSEGGSVQDIVSFQDEEVGITLLVTPHICENDEILLDVNPSVAEIIGYSGSAENQKPITSERSIRTKIMVKNGETAVLGGLLKETKIEKEDKVFILGSIPLLGNFFKRKTTQSSNTDLIILITPTIMTD